MTSILMLSLVTLPAFDPNNWEAVERAFAATPTHEFAQAWRETRETRFRPATARLGRRGDSLWVYAVLQDENPFNAATAPNQATWKSGDVFEIFLRPAGQQAYFELHVTPQNQTLQLRWPDDKSVWAKTNWRTLTVERPLLVSWTRIEKSQWRVLVEVPARGLIESADAEGEWAFSLGRYDVTRGESKPVLSSVARHLMPKFHRQHEWPRFNWAKENS